MSRSLVMVLGLVVVAAACSRTGDQLPLDVNEGAGGDGGAPLTSGAGPTTAGPSSGSTSAQGTGSMTTSASGMTTASSSSSGSTTNASSSSTGGPADCVLCIVNECPQVQTCITDPACAQGLACVVTDCGVGGTPDFQCLLGCFEGDVGAALDALEAIGCIFGTCGDLCAGFIPQGA